MRMGQGDCTVIKTPSGKVYMIDLGSSEGEPYPSDPDSIYSPQLFFEDPKLFGTYKTLNGLILTHADKDHYNGVGLLHKMGLSIDKVYHSDFFTSYNKGSSLGGSGGGESYGYIALMCKYTTGTKKGETDYTNIRGVTYTDDDKKFTNYDPDSKELVHTDIVSGNGIDQYTDARGVKIHDEGGCRIYLLVSNLLVEDPSSRASKRQKSDEQKNYEKRRGEDFTRNMGSIVTLVEFKSRQFVICGDAIGETAEFVMGKYADVADVELLQAPHHGSNSHDSSSLNFVQRMNPRTLVISAMKKSRSQSLPRCETITNFIDNAARVTKKANNSKADPTDYGCYFEDKTGKTDPLKRGKSKDIYYDEMTGKRAMIRITGWHDDMLFINR